MAASASSNNSSLCDQEDNDPESQENGRRQKYNYFSTLCETEDTEDFVKPTQVQDVHVVSFCVRQRIEGSAYGKWMIFKHWDELDEAWERVRTAVLRDELQGCAAVGCSTMLYNPSVSGPGPDLAGVICVYTQEHDMDIIGFKLIEMEQHDIKYKTEQDSIDYKYTFNSTTPVSIKTMYWNDGKPSFECVGRPHKSTSHRRDVWRLNVVEAPESLNFGRVEGRWVLFLEYKELTAMWHYLKRMIESKEKDFGAVRMVCPPKRVHNSPTELPELHVQTTRERKREVGRKLITIVRRDIVYQYKPRQYSPPEQGQRGSYGLLERDNYQNSLTGRGRRDRYQYGSSGQGGRGSYQHGPPGQGERDGYQHGPSGQGVRGGYHHRPQRYSAPSKEEEVLYWNDGEPDYEKVTRKGITKNWRTGEDVIQESY